MIILLELWYHHHYCCISSFLIVSSRHAVVYPSVTSASAASVHCGIHLCMLLFVIVTNPICIDMRYNRIKTIVEKYPILVSATG